MERSNIDALDDNKKITSENLVEIQEGAKIAMSHIVTNKPNFFMRFVNVIRGWFNNAYTIYTPEEFIKKTFVVDSSKALTLD